MKSWDDDRLAYVCANIGAIIFAASLIYFFIDVLINCQ